MQLPENLALVGSELAGATARDARGSSRRRRRVLVLGVAALAIAVTGASALADGWLGGSPPVPASAAAGRLTALFAQPAGGTPSERILEQTSGFGVSAWRRLPAVEAYLGVPEVDIGETPDGRICMELIASGPGQPGAGGCLRQLRPGGDMQTLVTTAMGQPVRMLGIVPDAVQSVSVDAAGTSTPAYVGDDVVAWVAPADDPARTPTGSTITLTDGTTLTTDSGMSVASP
jgi:hypothetical protein